MSLHTLIESSPLGATLLVSNGKPRPPERFNRKLSDWNRENYVGTLVATEMAPGQRPAIMVRKGSLEDNALVIFSARYPLDTSLRFEVKRRPTPGSARVVRANRRELLHLAANHAGAVKWLADNLISDAVIEIVTEAESDIAEDAA
ncbi:hypothetical protein [Aureimonas ureilytica]|uniref:hypothetical protein n=1 Tax=Aureimonas ureilytica TaxID=401562 RepID=UPI0003705B07|nr:hypothetical protein [Aureimonas ureilytica]